MFAAALMVNVPELAIDTGPELDVFIGPFWLMIPPFKAMPAKPVVFSGPAMAVVPVLPFCMMEAALTKG